MESLIIRLRQLTMLSVTCAMKILVTCNIFVSLITPMAGVRWRAPVPGASEEPEFTGLQVYINQQPAAMVVHGQTPSAIPQPPLDPPEFMVRARPARAHGESSTLRSSW